MEPEFNYDSLGLEYQILDYLNAGGRRQAVVSALRLHFNWKDKYSEFIFESDVTGDGVPELLYTEWGGWLHIFLCGKEKYRNHAGVYRIETPIQDTWHSNRPHIIHILDLNLDGVVEIVASAGDGRLLGVDVIEWSGEKFESLNLDAGDGSCASMLGGSSLEITDLDKNGSKELIFHQGIPIWSEYHEGMPWRTETRTCSWNGKQYVQTHIEYSAPIYRFQAIQDADRFALDGEYERAVNMYRQVIFNDSLEWWSLDRSNYERELSYENSTPGPAPVPDPLEYSYLAAYARFRIMVLHTLRGYHSDAKTVYDGLMDKYSSEAPGHEFVEMARRFTEEYQQTSDIGAACKTAVMYAQSLEGILAYLGGNYYHGWQSHKYVPADVCPFR